MTRITRWSFLALALAGTTACAEEEGTADSLHGTAETSVSAGVTANATANPVRALSPRESLEVAQRQVLRTAPVEVQAVADVPFIMEHPGAALLEFGDIRQGADGTYIVEIRMANATPVAGFQFTLTGGSPQASTAGRAGAGAFEVATGRETGIVLGYNLSGELLDPGAGTLTEITVSPEGGSLCLEGIIISSPEGTEVESHAGNCLTLE